MLHQIKTARTRRVRQVKPVLIDGQRDDLCESMAMKLTNNQIRTQRYLKRIVKVMGDY